MPATKSNAQRNMLNSREEDTARETVFIVTIMSLSIPANKLYSILRNIATRAAPESKPNIPKKRYRLPPHLLYGSHENVS